MTVWFRSALLSGAAQMSLFCAPFLVPAGS